MSKSEYIEPFLDERLEAASEFARKIVNRDIDNIYDFQFVLRMVIAEARHMGIFDKYFDDLTIDQLAFEAGILKESREPTREQTSETIKAHTEEAESLFDEWIDEDLPTNFGEDMEDSVAKEFMQTGKFKGEDDEPS